MFRVDKDDGLFTLNSVFVAIKNEVLFLLTLEDDSSITKRLQIWNIELLKWMPIELHHLPKIPWKLGNDAVRAKDVAKLNKFFEEIEFDFYFWHETLKVEKNFENIRDFYLQSIKPRLEYELSKQ